jgi:pyrimidine deaminase RibD-like protein
VAIEEATGCAMDRFFDQWVFGGRIPTVEASWSWDRRDGGGAARAAPDARAVTTAEGCSSSGSTSSGARRIAAAPPRQVETAEQVVYLQVPARPRWLRIDPSTACS